jgi:hypothetical protein
MRLQKRKWTILQRWEGIVVAVEDKTSITLRLIDLNDHNAMDEIAAVPIEEFSPSDVENIAEGDVFYWTIGYEEMPDGSKSRFSKISAEPIMRHRIHYPIVMLEDVGLSFGQIFKLKEGTSHDYMLFGQGLGGYQSICIDEWMAIAAGENETLLLKSTKENVFCVVKREQCLETLTKG